MVTELVLIRSEDGWESEYRNNRKNGILTKRAPFINYSLKDNANSVISIDISTLIFGYVLWFLSSALDKDVLKSKSYIKVDKDNYAVLKSGYYEANLTINYSSEDNKDLIIQMARELLDRKEV